MYIKAHSWRDRLKWIERAGHSRIDTESLPVKCCARSLKCLKDEQIKFNLFMEVPFTRITLIEVVSSR